jgi:hypothetical protein
MLEDGSTKSMGITHRRTQFRLSASAEGGVCYPTGHFPANSKRTPGTGLSSRREAQFRVASAELHGPAPARMGVRRQRTARPGRGRPAPGWSGLGGAAQKWGSPTTSATVPAESAGVVKTPVLRRHPGTAKVLLRRIEAGDQRSCCLLVLGDDQPGRLLAGPANGVALEVVVALGAVDLSQENHMRSDVFFDEPKPGPYPPGPGLIVPR